MTEKIVALVLNVRKYNDKNVIVTAYTRSRGRLSFISPLGTGKASNARRARLQPLSLITTELNYKPGTELQRLGSISLVEPWNDLYFNNTKRSLSLFISEFLYRLLIATMPEENLFDFLVDSLRLLDRMEEGTGDFHIPFLVSMLSYAGIQPDISGYAEDKIFDFNTGSFQYSEEAGPIALSPFESKAVKFVARLNYNNIKKVRLNNVSRRQILYGLLNYFSFHYPGISSLKSVEVLREIFE